MRRPEIDQNTFQKLLEKQRLAKTTDAEDNLIEEVWNCIQEGALDFDWSNISQESVQQRIKKRIDSKISNAQKPRHVIGFWDRRMVAAIVFLLGLGALIYFSQFKNETNPLILIEKQTSSIQRAKVTLPDGTVVQMNVNSSLKYPEQFEESNRTVLLEGEAFFEVVRDTTKPFYVKTQQLNTKVLGTSFNVNAYPGRTEVITVNTGKVRVSSNEFQEQMVDLLPNEAVTRNQERGILETEQVVASRIIAWTSGHLEFDMLPFDQVIAQLEQFYHQEIILENYSKGSCLIKASFENNGLNFILSNLQLLADFSYEETMDGKLRIHFKSCGKR